MANVLPQEEKKRLHSDYKRRLLVVGLCFLSALLLAAIVMLIPSLVIFSVKKETITKQLEFLRESEQVSVTTEALAEIKEAREQMKRIAPDENIEMSAKISELVSRKPVGVSISSLIVSAPSFVEMRGEASNREAILAYVRALESSLYVEKVDSPISNLISGQNSQFVIKVTTKEKL